MNSSKNYQGITVNQKIRKFVLSHICTRELFFFLRHKKVNKAKIDRKIRQLHVNMQREKIDVIVSLTSYGERLNELQYTLYSLVTQTVHPEKIIVNLAEQDFANLPQLLRLFEQYGVEYRQTEDLKSYKKLIPTLQAYPEKCIVTADDDLFYPKDWLEKLWKGHLKNQNVVVCHLTNTITFTNGRLDSYNTRIYNKGFSAPSYKNFILSGAGALFPPHCFYGDVCNVHLFTSLVPTADDIWDYFMCILQGTKIMQISYSYTNVCYVNPYREYGIKGGETLAEQNVGQRKNDIQFRAVMNQYELTDSKFERLVLF